MTEFEPDAEGLRERRERLARGLASLESAAIAFSGGVDSSVLLHAAHRALGARAVGVIADSPSLPRRELEEALGFADAVGARIEVVATKEGEDERYRANAGDRCYFCKSALFSAMESVAREKDLRVLAFGEITDDFADDRPGRRAAREFQVVAPLAEAGFSKGDVRRYAREEGLSVAEKPASACLASRIPVGTRVSPELLSQVERAEAGLRELGLSVLRVRHHGKRAGVEVGGDELRFAELRRAEIEVVLRRAGFESFELGRYLLPADRQRRETSGELG